ncbi:MAG TPA: hypothetical protein VM223_04320 [Planctomycetota bacterium]|nr:hypothetical protein [Planctomycetota bacterium]
MKKLLIVDEDQSIIEGDVNRVYLDIDEPPFEFQITTAVDEAIRELRRFPYELVLSSEFLPDAVPGMLWDDVFYKGDVLRLLEFCTDNMPRTKVCVVTDYTMTDETEELYKSYPCVLDVFGQPHSDRVYKAQDKRLRKILDTFAGARTVV